MYEYRRAMFLKSSVSFNFVKHWRIRNLFNDEIFPIYGMYYDTRFMDSWDSGSKRV